MTDPSASEAPAERTSSMLDPVEGLGDRLTVLREQRGRNISSLARQIGVSPSLLSQIERGQSRPSVATLFALAEALGAPVDAFFRDRYAELPAPRQRPDPLPRGPRYMVRRDERAKIEIRSGVRGERLTPRALAGVEFLELVYAPGAESSPTLYRHPGTEMVTVTQGRLDVYVGFDHYELGPGDSIHFPSAFPHRYVNPGEDVTRAITVLLSEPESGDAPAPRRP